MKPANKKSSPKQDLREEKFTGSRYSKRATQKSHRKALAWKVYGECHQSRVYKPVESMSTGGRSSNVVR